MRRKIALPAAGTVIALPLVPFLRELDLAQNPIDALPPMSGLVRLRKLALDVELLRPSSLVALKNQLPANVEVLGR